MSKKQQERTGGLVFSTNRDLPLQADEESVETLPPAQQKLRVHIETKHRGGKTATLVTGFVGSEADLEALGKLLKTKCGTGGSTKDGEIIIQGNTKEKIIEILKAAGYTNSK